MTKEKRTVKHAAAISTLETPIGAMRLAATRRGLCKITLGNETQNSFKRWLSAKRLSISPTPEAEAALRQTETQLLEYLSGTRRQFDLPLDLRGTTFQQIVWNAVTAIPYGETTTYGAIAAHIGRPSAARAVGAANGANPVPVVVPCHRVLGTDGALTGYGGGLPVKRALLALEQTGRLPSCCL
jgi:O-6-methylguanine DNA methyltransferase